MPRPNTMFSRRSTVSIHPDDRAVPTYEDAGREHWADEETREIERAGPAGAKVESDYDPFGEER